ncbi:MULTISPECIES: M56 family metallopeptidase [Streptomyces]|uniref:Zn-dependent protease with chaperone function n=1 Tax=Streptomyces nymphaeiformis TaxID=2663842 RepID=A0A7W7U760_9ACTN|nr:M56 family metallopeptidase [Streptomyces nymphaeiformis]MBB4986230.1 Zn-dependent protease with chaperone function [Streptomyces nymphaeiformis]
MNHHLLIPLGLVLVTGVLVPWLLARARWPQQVPRLALGVWAACGAGFAAGAALLPAQLVLTGAASHRLSDMMFTFRPPTLDQLLHLDGRERFAFSLSLLVLSVPTAAFVRRLARARRMRTRHAGVLRLVGRYDATLRATVLDDERPAVYCLPGRSRRVVVSSGAVDTLTPAQLGAALAHERAHISGRHHLLVAAAEAFAAVFPHLPLARHGGSAVPLLLEMTADDRALRRCTRDALATALYALASGRAPRSAFGAGGPSAALRMRRILTPHSAGHPVLYGLLTIAAGGLSMAPLVIACCSFPQ